jgi:Gamma tubulin complex component C-terminal
LVKTNSQYQATLEWSFDWPDIDQVVRKAQDYEASLRAAVNDLSLTVTKLPSSPVQMETTDDDFESSIEQSMKLMDQLSTSGLTQSKLDLLIRDSLFADDKKGISFFPPLSLVPSLSFTPLLTTQSAIIKTTILKLLFQSHHLRHHLGVLYSFFLFGDGLFISRLSTALFDTDASTTERQLGKMRGAASGMGMRVGFRDTWPPASSEVRLALMGLLSDCYQQSRLLKQYRSKLDGPLPGDLSFSIRTDIEEAILDPHNLRALDFLKLTFAPKSPLDEVLSQKALGMYDEMFKFLLRISRAIFVVSRLPTSMPMRTRGLRTRSNVDSKMMKLTMHARHIVGALAAYIFDAVIDSGWKDFQKTLDTLEHTLFNGVSCSQKEVDCPTDLPSLRKLHESALKNMMRGCFLHHKQAVVKTQLDNILSTVLQAEKLSFDIEKGQASSWESSIEMLANQLDEQVKIFLISCRDMTSKAKISGMEDFLRGCDWNGVYGVWTSE